MDENAVEKLLKNRGHNSIFAPGDTTNMLLGMEAMASNLSNMSPREIRRYIIEKLPDDFYLISIPYEWLDLDEVHVKVCQQIHAGRFSRFDIFYQSLDGFIDPKDRQVRENLLGVYLRVVSMCSNYAKKIENVEIYLNVFDKGEYQKMAYFCVIDKDKEHEKKYNFHGYNTSQVVCNGAIVFNVKTKQISIHT